jgi:hypothetical protein
VSFVTNMLLGTMPQVRVPDAPPRKRAKSPNHKTTLKALARYKAVMGDDWIKTFEIKRRLGAQNGSLQKTLRDWYASGFVERRQADKGYEWRMK